MGNFSGRRGRVSCIGQVTGGAARGGCNIAAVGPLTELVLFASAVGTIDPTGAGIVIVAPTDAAAVAVAEDAVAEDEEEEVEKEVADAEDEDEA